MRTDAQRKAHFKYYASNREKVKARTAQWREDNREFYLRSQKKYSQERRERDPELAKRRARGYALKRKYGITLEQYEELLQKQNYSCAICERHESEFKTNLAVDHAHSGPKKGFIRGLLCTACNYRLVARHTDGDLLRRIADYVEQSTDWIVPDNKKSKRKKNAKT